MTDIKTREGWLTEVSKRLIPTIETEAKIVYGNSDLEMPPFRIAMGFPSVRALSQKSRRMGECWSGAASADGAMEILISPTHSSAIDIVGTVAHELVHCIDRNKNKHKGPFVRVVRRLGLEGKPTATVPGAKFTEEIIKPILSELPEMPFVQMIATKRSAPKPSLIKTTCDCGYTSWITSKWLNEGGSPFCPIHGTQMRVI